MDILLHISYSVILSYFISYYISFIFRVILPFTSCSCNVYYHYIAVLCFSYHIIYHIHLICIYLSFSFMFHACINLRSGYGTKLYVPKGTITVRDSDLYMYVPEGTITVQDSDLYMYVIDLNGASISVNCMLQQLYPYRHAYLSLYQVLSR